MRTPTITLVKSAAGKSSHKWRAADHAGRTQTRKQASSLQSLGVRHFPEHLH